MVVAFVGLGLVPSYATAPPFEIVIDGGSPYYYPASAKVTAGAPIRWDNPTGSPQQLPMTAVWKMVPARSIPVPCTPMTLIPFPGAGRYPYQCRLHPIMRGTLVIVESPDVSSQT